MHSRRPPKSTGCSVSTASQLPAPPSAFQPDINKDTGTDLVRSYVESLLRRAPEGTLLERLTYMDARTSLSDNLLLCGDKMAMAASVEMRVPFLDLEIMRIARASPVAEGPGLRNKVIHKRCVSGGFPDSVHRRKVGFHEGRELAETEARRGADRLTGAPDSITRQMLNPGFVRELQRAHTSGKNDYQRLLFLLLSWKHGTGCSDDPAAETPPHVAMVAYAEYSRTHASRTMLIRCLVPEQPWTSSRWKKPGRSQDGRLRTAIVG